MGGSEIFAQRRKVGNGRPKGIGADKEIMFRAGGNGVAAVTAPAKGKIIVGGIACKHIRHRFGCGHGCQHRQLRKRHAMCLREKARPCAT